MMMSRVLLSIITLVVVVLSIVGCSTYPSPPETDARNRGEKITQYLDQLIEEDRFPGMQYLVVNRETVLFRYAGGEAVIGQQPMTLDTPMRLYSSTKVLTAIAVLQLVEKGKINLDDPLIRYLPDIPYRTVTIRQVMSHTAGIPNPIIGNMYIYPEGREVDETRMLLDVMEENGELDFDPGSEFAYSNLGYALLGKVIEVVSGDRYESYLRENILSPLGIAPGEASFSFDTFATESRGYIERFSLFNLVMSFMIDELTPSVNGKWKHFEEHWYFLYPSMGGLLATGNAVSRILLDLLQEQSVLLTTEMKPLLYEVQIEADSFMIGSTHRAAGWFVNRDREPYYFHEGSAFGYVAELRIYPEKGVATVLLVNTTRLPHKKLMDLIDGQFMQ